MAYEHILTQSIKTNSRSVEKVTTLSAAAQAGVSEAIGIGASDLAVTLAIDVSALVSVFMVADQDLTIETNDGTTPDDTINLLANKPYIWNTGSPPADKLTADVATLFVTNASGVAATLDVEVLTDPTP